MTRIVLRNVTMLAGPQFEEQTGDLVTEGGRIASLDAQMELRPNDEVHDLSGAVVVPGLMDAHCHLIYFEVADPYDIELKKSLAEAAMDAVHNAGALLDLGFTTIRDVGSRGNIGVEARRAIEDGRIRGPKVHAAGQIISAPGGLGDFHPSHIFDHGAYNYSLALQIVGPHEARAVVRRQLKDGVDWIKVGVSGTGFNPLCPAERNGLSDVEFEAVVDEARQQGVPVAAHAESQHAVHMAAAQGVATIEHGIYIDDQALDAMLANGVTLSPTLSMYRAFAQRGAELGIPKEIVDEHKRTIEIHAESVRRAYKAGVPIVAGGDAGLTHFPQGQCVEELASYVNVLGMEPHEAFATLTINIARLLGVDDSRGTIEVGKQADLLVLRGNPLDDPDLLQRPESRIMVLQEGVVVASRTATVD